MVELSVIIPTYNRAERLRACLEALCHQTQPAIDFEVIVVVDGSTDDTCELLATLTTPFSLQVIWQKNSGQQVARNRGAALARGRYCLFLDDDIIGGANLIAEHLMVLRQRKDVVGIGQITLRLPADADWFARCFAQGWQEHYAELNRGTRQPSWMDCYGGNMSLSRAAFLEVGGFAPDVPRSHDIELGYRLELQGLSFVYIPGAVGDQDERKGIREFAADAEKAGAMWVELSRRHPPMLPHLLGSFGEVSLREAFLRNAFLAFGISPRFLVLIGSLFKSRSWNQKWYRFLLLYCYWRGICRALPDRVARRRLARGTPIFMYHAFSQDEPAGRFVLPIRRFARQMAWLKLMGYHVLGLEQLLTYRREFRLPPPQSVVITIDDGYAETHRLAWPILRRYGFAATVFLVSDAIGGTNQWARSAELKGRALLSWPDIEEMQGYGMQFGAHTRTHPALVAVSPARAQEEVGGSKAELERKLNVPVNAFAYPYGEYDAAAQAIVEGAGFLGGCGAESGLNTFNTPRYALRRIELYGTDSLLHFALALWLGYVPSFLRGWKTNGQS